MGICFCEDGLHNPGPKPATQAATAPPAAPTQRPIGMWDQERDSPWLHAGLYALAVLVGLLGHHVAGWCALLWGAA